MTFPFLQFGSILLLFACFPSQCAWGQCSFEQVLHTFGTEQVGCTEITVTSDGSAFPGPSPAPPCIYGPYGIGNSASGSFTFTFSPAVAEVSINVISLDNSGGSTEEMVLEVNGVFYPLGNPGTPDGCQMPAVIWPPGTLRGPVGSSGSSKDIIITGNMTSLKIEDNHVSGTPGGILVSLSVCCLPCQTDAGEITASPINLCPNDIATVPPAGQTFLENDDLLQYILFSDQADPTGSILATNNTPEFAFDPATMQTGITYYIAAIAGNDLGGNVDLNDPCLDISNAIEVVWSPFPTVAFSTANPNICLDGCSDVIVEFTGTAPFTLTYMTPSAGSVTETFFANNGNIQICTPLGTPLGNWELQATDLVDANCTCN